jgi:hypothetical protein
MYCVYVNVKQVYLNIVFEILTSHNSSFMKYIMQKFYAYYPARYSVNLDVHT